jgi:CheY-like chemotaxis protein
MYLAATEKSGNSTDRAALVRPTQRTVLLVDDDPDFRFALAETLRDEGHHVMEARSGEAAFGVLDHLAAPRARAPDLIVLDLVMPGMSGIEFLQRLRRSPRWARLPVLIVTGVNDSMLPVRLDLPIAFKPDTDVVLDTIRQHLAHPPPLGPEAAASPSAAPS